VSSSRVRTIVVATVGVLATVGALAVSAAGEGLKTKSKTVELDMGEVGSALAKCKPGTKSVSGGFEAEFDAGPPPVVVLSTASRRASTRKWRASGASLGAEGELTAFAYCRDQKLKSKKKQTDVDGASGIDPGTDTATAKCPKGSAAVSGGFDNPDAELNLMGPGSTFIHPIESRKIGKRKWRAGGNNYGEADGTLVAQVNCYEGRSLKTRSETDEVTNTAPDTAFDEFAARCKRGERVVSGGFSIEEQNISNGPLVIASRKQGKRAWVVETGSNGSDAEVTVYAYCERA
jgi:hypothetical protein